MPPDQITLINLFLPELPCSHTGVQAGLDTHLLPIESGNVQVR